MNSFLTKGFACFSLISLACSCSAGHSLRLFSRKEAIIFCRAAKKRLDAEDKFIDSIKKLGKKFNAKNQVNVKKALNNVLECEGSCGIFREDSCYYLYDLRYISKKLYARLNGIKGKVKDELWWLESTNKTILSKDQALAANFFNSLLFDNHNRFDLRRTLTYQYLG